MTNKPMLSVDRELLENHMRLLACAGLMFTNVEGLLKSIDELRALLDKPATERKPFAWYRVPKDFPLQGAFFPYIEGQSESDIQNSMDAEFGFNVKRLYDEPAAQQQGEPVACLIRSRNIITQANIAVDGKYHYSAWSEWEPSALEYGRAVTDPRRNEPVCYEMELLFKEQPAPVAVVIDIESAANKFAQCMGCTWEHISEQGRQSMREHAKAVVESALTATSLEVKS